MTVFNGTTYLYPTPSHGTRQIGVCQVMAGLWGVAWIAETGGRHRIKSRNLPVLADPDKLQCRLDLWAAERELQLIWSRHDSMTVSILSLACVTVDEAIVATWTDEQCQQAEEWAGAVHYDAADNDVEVPDMPAFLEGY